MVTVNISKTLHNKETHRRGTAGPHIHRARAESQDKVRAFCMAQHKEKDWAELKESYPLTKQGLVATRHRLHRDKS